MKISGWSKAFGTVLGIVLVGFSAAMIATLFNETPYASRLELPRADFGQKRSFGARAEYTANLTVGGIRQARTLISVAHPALADDRDLMFPFTHPQSIQFSVEHHLTVGSYNLDLGSVQRMLYEE